MSVIALKPAGTGLPMSRKNALMQTLGLSLHDHGLDIQQTTQYCPSD